MDERPRTFQFRLASLLWLMLVAAILLGWYSDRVRIMRDLDQQRVEQLRQQADAHKQELQKATESMRSANLDLYSKLLRYREMEQNDRDRARALKAMLDRERESQLLKTP